MKKSIVVWEISGAFIISSMGSLLHFVFAFVDEWPPAALIAAVNESVWEHLKLAFWPAFIYALIQWPFFRKKAKNFWTAKTFGILSMPVIIASFFYAYTSFSGHNILWLDISLFVFAVFAGQMISWRLLLLKPVSPRRKILAMALLVLVTAAFSLFTFFPPHLPIFCDPRTGQFGIFP
jgi:cation transport ATPase